MVAIQSVAFWKRTLKKDSSKKFKEQVKNLFAADKPMWVLSESEKRVIEDPNPQQIKKVDVGSAI